MCNTHLVCPLKKFINISTTSLNQSKNAQMFENQSVIDLSV